MKTVMKEEIRVEYCVVSSHVVVVLLHSDLVNESAQRCVISLL